MKKVSRIKTTAFTKDKVYKYMKNIYKKLKEALWLGKKDENTFSKTREKSKRATEMVSAEIGGEIISKDTSRSAGKAEPKYTKK